MRTARSRSILSLLAVPVLGAWLVLAAGHAVSTTPIVITFDGDAGGQQPIPFASVANSEIRFDVVDYAGFGPCDATTCPPSPGAFLNVFGSDRGNMLQTGNGTPTFNRFIVLRLTFARPTQALRLSLGYDTFAVGDSVVLTGFRGGQRVASISLPADVTPAVDQEIVLQGYVIDSAVVQMNVDGAPGIPASRPASQIYVNDVRSDALCSVVGGNGNDTLTGTGAADVLCGGPGNDTLTGAGGNDLILGNLGNDRLLGGPGNDNLQGGTGTTDSCTGGPGTDTSSGCETRTSIP